MWLVRVTLTMSDMSLAWYYFVTFSVWQRLSLKTDWISHYLLAKGLVDCCLYCFTSSKSKQVHFMHWKLSWTKKNQEEVFAKANHVFATFWTHDIWEYTDFPSRINIYFIRWMEEGNYRRLKSLCHFTNFTNWMMCVNCI